MAPVIRFENVSKRYRIGSGRGSLREALSNLPRHLLHRLNSQEPRTTDHGPSDRYIWALKDVSFEVQPGEALGIIGPNGAGKTTALKLLSRITRQTKGQIVINGRLSALIELGAGFHPDLTGHENVYLNGTILGLTRREIDAKIAAIVEFAELEQFIDTPVKRYSSGMYARLGFSVAAHVDPDILLVDEVLSVGDISFQNKCIQHMRAFRDSGRTVVFVSHSLTAVQALCDRAIWLHRGQIRDSGPSDQVVARYLDAYDRAMADEAAIRQEGLGTGDLLIRRVELLNHEGVPTDEFQVGDDICVRLYYHARRRIERPHFWFGVSTTHGNSIFGAATLFDDQRPDYLEGEGIIECTFHKVPLMPRVYQITGGFRDSTGTTKLVETRMLASFRIVTPLAALGFRADVAESLSRFSAPVLVPYEWKLQPGSGDHPV